MHAPAGAASRALDVEAIRADFPILGRTVRGGRRLVYLDSGDTSQKPRQVLDAWPVLQQHNANVHRGAHTARRGGDRAYEGARDKVAAFIGAPTGRGRLHQEPTEAINLVAYSIANARRVRVTASAARATGRHHRDGAPLQHRALAAAVRADRRDAALVRRDRRRPARPLRRLDGLIDERPSSSRSRTVQRARHGQPGRRDRPPRARRRRARAGGRRPVGAAQPVDVAALGADFVAFTGHKMRGPTGIGVLWGRHELLEAMPPFLGGG